MIKEGLISDITEIDLGTTFHGEKREFTVNIKNITDLPITPTCGAECGCTTPKLSPTTILPQESAILICGFDSMKKSGFQKKKVWVAANGIKTVTIIFKTNVVKAQG